jgi:hypothetical protein
VTTLEKLFNSQTLIWSFGTVDVLKVSAGSGTINDLVIVG